MASLWMWAVVGMLALVVAWLLVEVRCIRGQIFMSNLKFYPIFQFRVISNSIVM